MTNVSLELRNLLKSKFVINHIKIDKFQKSNDGTIKNAISLYDNLLVESVLIPTNSRTTACISSQVGCSLDCEFCATSKMNCVSNENKCNKCSSNSLVKKGLGTQKIVEELRCYYL